MSYKINKNANKNKFIVKYNHRQKLLIQDGAELVDGVYTEFTYALLPNEIMHTEQAEIEVPNYETVLEEYQEPIYSEVEKTTTDENGEEITYIDLEITGYETKTREVQVENGTKMVTVTLCYPIINPNYEAEEAQKEAERVGNLKCTKRVFALMLQELGITYTQLKTLIATSEQAQLEWDLCVELERKNPLLDIMASQLGITPIQLDGLFKYANGEITLEDFKGSTSVEVSESDTEVEADGE